MGIRNSRFIQAMNKSIPRSLRLGRFPYVSVLYTFLFAVFFLFIYNPFSTSVWISYRPLGIALKTILFFVLAIIIMTLSKAIFLQYASRHRAKNWIYILWSVGECAAIAVLYLAFSSVFSLGSYISTGSMILKTIFCVCSILVIPHTVIYITASYTQVREDMELLKTTASDDAPPRQDNLLSQRMINFIDDSGVLRFSIDIDSILYIKSEGNYMNLFYEKADGTASYLMRMTMSSLETKVSGTPLIRCQRSYIVNTRRIRMMQNDGKGAYIILDADNVPVIPLSQNYASALADAVLKKKKASAQ